MAKNILVIHQGAIGDFILSLPALQTIRQALPACRLELLGYPATLALAGDLADTISSIDRSGLSSLYGDFQDSAASALEYISGFDRIFIFSAGQASPLLENLRLATAGCEHIKTFPPDRQHVVDWQLAQLQSLGFAAAAAVPQLGIRADHRQRAVQFLNHQALTHGPLIAVHPGSGSSRKNWPCQYLVRFLQQLHEERQAFFLIISGPAEQSVPQDILALPHGQLENCDLLFVAAAIAQCRLFIGNDSGITHLAAAAGAPTLAIFGPTDPVVWGPRGKKVCMLHDHDHQGQWRWPEPQIVFDCARRLLEY